MRTLLAFVVLLTIAPAARAATVGPPADYFSGSFSYLTQILANAQGTTASVETTDTGGTEPGAGAVSVQMRRADGRRSARYQLGSAGGAEPATATAIDRAGALTVLWTLDGGGGAFAARCTFGGCTRPRTITRADATGPTVAVNARRDVLMAWREGSRVRYRLGEAGRPARTGSFRGAEDDPRVVAAGDRFVALWQGRDGVRSATFRRGGRVSAPRAAGIPQLPASTQVAGTRDDVLVAYESGRTAVVAYADVAGRFSRRQTFTLPRPSGPLSLAASRSGRAVLVASRDCATPGGGFVLAALRAPGGRFGRAVALEQSAADCFDADAAIDDAGGAAVTWAPRVGGAVSIATARAGGFGAAQQAAPPCESACGALSPRVVAAGRQTMLLWAAPSFVLRGAPVVP